MVFDGELRPVELLPQQEHLVFPPIRWTIIDKPVGGDDYFLQRKGRTYGERLDVVVVADGASTNMKIGEESVSRLDAKVFSERFAEALLRGESIDSARIHGEKEISSAYYTDDEARSFERLMGRPISIFDGSKKKAQFALAAARIIYPIQKTDNFSIEVVNHRDCFFAALIPTEENDQVVFKPKVYPLAGKGITISADSLPPGSILLTGSDGVFSYIADHTRNLYDARYDEGKNKNDMEIAIDIASMKDHFGGGTLAQDKETIEKLLAQLVEIQPIEQGDETAWIDRLKEGIENSISQAGTPIHDVTLLMTNLPTLREKPLSNVNEIITRDALTNHKTLTKLLLSLQAQESEIDLNRASPYRRQELTRMLRDFTQEERKKLAQTPLSLEVIKSLALKLDEENLLILEPETIDQLRKDPLVGVLSQLYLKRDIREAIEKVESKALESSSPVDYLWGYGIPHNLAEKMSSTNIEDQLSILDYFLHQYDPPADNARIEQIFSSRLAAEYISRLVAQNNIEPKLFANVATLVRYDDLNEKTKRWFQNKGVVLLNQPIRVHQRHMNDFGRVGEVPCHEVGHAILGQFGKSLEEIMEHESELEVKGFTPYYSSENCPGGSLAEVNYLNRWWLAVAGSFVAGQHPKARGIIVPFEPGGVIYMGTENSFKPNGQQNFYVRQIGVDPIAEYAFSQIYKKLQKNA